MKRKPIDRQLLKSWKLRMFDITQDEVKAATGLSKPTLRIVFKEGRATQETIDKLTLFFSTTKIPA